MLDRRTRLGPYEIVDLIGAGGMGEVYRARDTRLDRIVAIKILSAPPADGGDEKRVQRFEREARAISSLNHPHICTLYDVGRAAPSPASGSEPPIDFLVMEYLEGQTLADTLSAGALSIDRVLRYSIQMADALDKAHRRGIIHRDLKPSNVMLTRSGVKLLDFGLAKLRHPDDGEGSLSRRSTRAADLTGHGHIIGTLQYMAPEQLREHESDDRTDVFALGAIVYEMVTRARVFHGESQAMLIASILDREPTPIVTLRPDTPPALERIIMKCLAKDPEDRWQTARDLTTELAWVGKGDWVADARSSTSPVRPWHRRKGPQAVLVGAALVLGSLVTGLGVWRLDRPDPPRLARFDITPEGFAIGQTTREIAISPNGAHVINVADGGRLVVRSLDRLRWAPLLGPENPRELFVSPDSNWLGFHSTDGLKRVPIQGGPSVTICQLAPGGISGADGRFINVMGANWGGDDTVVFGTSSPSGLWRVPASGGEPEELTTPDPKRGELNHAWPEILPRGEAVIFTIVPSGPIENAQVALVDLRTGVQKTLIPAASQPRYAATGHIVYGMGGTLRAVGFDLDRRETTTEPVVVLDGMVTKATGAAEFGFSQDGSLVYLSGAAASGRRLVWVDREGRAEALPGVEPGAYMGARVAPDGTRLAIHDAGPEPGNEDIWIYDIMRVVKSRLTTDARRDTTPLWTPDGQRVVFASNRTGEWSLFWKRTDGSGDAEHLLTRPGVSRLVPFAWSSDGAKLVFMETNSDTGSDLGVLSMTGERSAELLIRTEFNEGFASISPDGEWIVYASDRSGGWEIHMERFPELGEHRQLSTNGGLYPLWSRDGREVFYNSRGGQALLAVPVETEPTIRVGGPQVLFHGPHYTGSPRPYDTVPGEDRFIMVRWTQSTDSEGEPALILVQNWFEELKRLVPPP